MLPWLATALAQEPSAARLCAEAAAGTEVEVCLRLATAHPDQVDALSAALGAHIDRGSSADRELMVALLLLLGEGTGPQGADALGRLGDVRAVPPLVHAVHTREPAVALAAVDALGAYRGGLDPLAGWLLDPARPLDVRVRAAIALARTGQPQAADALVDALRRPRLPPGLRRAIRAAVLAHHPDRAHEMPHRVDRDGAAWVALATGSSAGLALATAARPSRPELSAVAGIAGALAGGTFGALGGRALPVEAGDAAFVAVNGLVGAGAGLALGAGLGVQDPDRVAAAGLIGNAGGVALGMALARVHPGTEADSLEAAAVGLGLAGVLGGALDVGARNGLSDPRATGQDPPLVGVGLGLLGGTALGHLIAPNIRFERHDWLMVAVAGGTGAAIGALAPLAGNRRGALPAVGGAAGMLAGFALAGSVDPDLDALGSGVLGAGYGAMMLGGAAAWARPDDRALLGAALLAGGVLGMGTGGLLADLDQDPIDDRDLVLMAYASGWTAAQTAGVMAVVDGDPLARTGPLLALPSVAGALVAGLSPILDVPVAHSSAAVSLGLWGTAVGGLTGHLLGQEAVPWAMVGGNAALVAGGICLSPVVGLTPMTVAAADAGGLLGGGFGLALGAALGEGDAPWVGGLVGASVGFAGGAVVGSWLRRTGVTRNIALTPVRFDGRVGLAPGPVVGARSAPVGLHLRVDGW